MMRMQPQWRFILDTLAEGRIGAVEAVHGWSCVQLPAPPSRIRAGVSCPGTAVRCSISAATRSTWRGTAFGAEPWRATARMWRDGGRDVAASIRLEFAAGHADLTVTTRLRPARGLVVLGSGGSLAVATPIHVPPGQRARVHAVLEGGPPAGEAMEFEAVPQYGLHLAAVSEAIRGGGRPPVGLDDALGNARALDAVIRSAEADGAWAEVARG